MIDRGQFKYEVLLPWCSQEQTIQVTQRRTLTKDHTKQWHEAFSKPSFHICINLFVPLLLVRRFYENLASRFSDSILMRILINKDI